jgi:1,4-dihydroxy-2-naphthoate octaprenyltransferase
MTTAGQWLAGARPRTLPAAVAPVLVGTAAADEPSAGRALLALVVALALQVGVNYANDYSDGVRGTDADRVGPLRLVGSGAAPPSAVRRAALLGFAVAAVAGLVLSLLTSVWLVVVGAVAIGAAWGYTGTPRPYGYRGLGEVSVFVFFGLVAVCGTAYVQGGRVTVPAVLGGVAMGALACAILVANNLRDLPTDDAAGKRTLAVRLGDAPTRGLYRALVVVGLLVPPALAAVERSPWPLLGLLAAPLAGGPLRAVRAGARGGALVPVLGGTGRLQLVLGALLAVGLALA